jgi:hypothetical protein
MSHPWLTEDELVCLDSMTRLARRMLTPPAGQDAERYRLIQARFAGMNSGQQRDFLGLLGIDYFEVAPLSKVIDKVLKEAR